MICNEVRRIATQNPGALNVSYIAAIKRLNHAPTETVQAINLREAYGALATEGTQN